MEEFKAKPKISRSPPERASPPGAHRAVRVSITTADAAPVHRRPAPATERSADDARLDRLEEAVRALTTQIEAAVSAPARSAPEERAPTQRDPEPAPAPAPAPPVNPAPMLTPPASTVAPLSAPTSTAPLVMLSGAAVNAAASLPAPNCYVWVPFGAAPLAAPSPIASPLLVMPCAPAQPLLAAPPPSAPLPAAQPAAAPAAQPAAMQPVAPPSAASERPATAGPTARRLRAKGGLAGSWSRDLRWHDPWALKNGETPGPPHYSPRQQAEHPSFNLKFTPDVEFPGYGAHVRRHVWESNATQAATRGRAVKA